MDEVVSAVLELFSCKEFRRLIEAVDKLTATISLEEDVSLEAEHMSKIID